MLRLIIIVYSFKIILCTTTMFVNPGPLYKPTKGEVWPKPHYQEKQNTYYKLNRKNFQFTVHGESCRILHTAMNRYYDVINGLLHISWRHMRKYSEYSDENTNERDLNFKGALTKLRIVISSTCQDYPQMGMNESYNLHISRVSSLNTDTIWGALRGMETFVQLLYLSDDYKSVFINGTYIEDYPRYPHRGVLIDTARHYISISNILKTLDAMEMNKLNVLHWHIVDDESFPYESEKYPELRKTYIGYGIFYSEAFALIKQTSRFRSADEAKRLATRLHNETRKKFYDYTKKEVGVWFNGKDSNSALGAYDQTLIYTKQNISYIVDYARDRGIRIIPELNVPGHSRSWGLAYPDIMTKCYHHTGEEIGLTPMNPTVKKTFIIITELIRELQEYFPEKYFHIGGDEVGLDCWNSNPDIIEFMKNHKMSNVSELLAYFIGMIKPVVETKSKLIVWQEVFNEGVPLGDSLIQVWKPEDIHTLVRILQAGHKLIYSSEWYLNKQRKGDNWIDYYRIDPRQLIPTQYTNFDLDNIVGGEACMWGEVVDDNNIQSRIWPRTSAVAEKLWSPEIPPYNNSYYDYKPPLEVYHRLEEHTCRMNRRGVNAQPPSGPGFCVTR